MTFKISLDKSATLITIGVTLLFALIIFGQFAFIKNAGKALPIYTSAALVLIYFLAFAFRPVNYKVSSTQLIIHRLCKNAVIAKENIKSVELIDRQQIRGSLRTFGSGGLFGYYGNFYNFNMGKMIWYATRRDKPVLIVTKDNKKIILTPDDPENLQLNLVKG